jgi:hypothetical protein
MNKLVASVLVSLFSLGLFSQKVVGYIDSKLNQAENRIPQLQWNKMTDFIFGFVQSDANGNFENPTDLQNFQACFDLAKANGVKFHISTGGAGLSSTLNVIA